MNNTDDNDNDSLITPAEKAMLDEAMHIDPLSKDEINLKRAELDDVDDDGDFLNEETSAVDNTGEDLDIPGSEDDDADEAIGEEDEENNGYSQADTA
jgi:hypothetical protein